MTISREVVLPPVVETTKQATTSCSVAINVAAYHQLAGVMQCAIVRTDANLFFPPHCIAILHYNATRAG